MPLEMYSLDLIHFFVLIFLISYWGIKNLAVSLESLLTVLHMSICDTGLHRSMKCDTGLHPSMTCGTANLFCYIKFACDGNRICGGWLTGSLVYLCVL